MTTEEKNTLVTICNDLLKTLDPSMEPEEADTIVAQSIKSIYLKLLDKRINIKVLHDGFCDYTAPIGCPRGYVVYKVKIIEQEK